MAPDSLWKCRECGRGEPEVHFVKQDFVRSYPTAGLVRIQRTMRICSSCLSAKVATKRKALFAARRETARANPPRQLRCVACGVEKPATDTFFAKRPNGVFFRRCRTCSRLWVRQYRRSQKYKLWLARSADKLRKKAKRNRKTDASLARLRRYNESQKQLKPSKVKWRNQLTEAIEKGKVVRPPECSRCKAQGVKLRAFFAHGHENYLNVVFVCFRCFYWITKGKELRRQELEDEREDRADGRRTSIYCGREEWERVHAENVRNLRAEERRLLSARRDKSLAGLRRLFLISICGYSKAEAEEVMAKEGPMECVLGHWLATERPRSRA